MECFEHGKEFVGSCNWCGKQLCRLCIVKQKGLKLYCGNCASKLSEFEDNKPVPREAPAQSMTHEIDDELGIKPVESKKPGLRFPFGKK